MRFRGRRLRSRIIWTTALVSAAAMAAMVLTVLLSLNAVTRNSVDSTLEDRLSVISSGVENTEGGFSRALESSDDAIDDSTWLFDGNGVQLEGPRAGRRVRATAKSLSEVSSKTRLERRERVYLAAPVTIKGANGGPGVLVVSESLEPYESTRREILIGLVCLGLLVTAGATAIAAWTVARTLAPVESMAGLADEWSERALDARFDDLGSESEIAHLGQTLNVLLDRVAGALRGEQRLTSELAHELRTPLTAIRGEAELGLMAEPGTSPRERLERVVSLADEMGTTISTLLAIARTEHPLHTRTTVDAVVTATLQSRTQTSPEVHVEEIPEEVRLNATTETGVRALAPLVDNALRHAASRVTIAVRVAPRSVDITVSDDGPGLEAADDDAESLFGAGTRGSASPGAGLGLPLARRVARTLGGEVSVTSMHAPTTFTLTLPRV